MAKKKKLRDPVVLFASIERDQHEALRTLAFRKNISIADLARSAIKMLLAEAKEKRKRRASRAAAN
jgi:hypothetical protein